MKRICGFFFLALGGGIGFWFLFQSLVPLIGYLESGALMSALFLSLGGAFLLWGRRRKPPSSLPMGLGDAQDIFKSMDIEKMLKNNVHKILLGAFIGGIVLSQFRDGKKIAEFKDKFPQVKDFLRDHLKL